MLSKSYLNFVITLLLKYKAKHLYIFFIATILIAILCSFMFVSSSIKRDVDFTLENQADFVLQRYEGGKVFNTPKNWLDEFSKIKGVSEVKPRVYGMHFYEPAGEYFMIVGVDFFDTNIQKSLNELIKNIDIAKFLQRNNMIIGSGVKQLFDYYEYKDVYTFRPPDRSKVKVHIYDTFAKESQIVSNDMIIMDIDLARKILGLKSDEVTDIALNVANPLERETVKIKLIISHFNMRIIEKEDVKRYYLKLFNYKGGVFLILYIVVILSFLLILYQRYTMSTLVDAKEIAILRLIGWKISDVIWLKVFENIFIVLFSYMLGVVLAYMYVFAFDAPLIKDIFLGYNNLENSVAFSPNIDFGALLLVFVMFVVPFLLAVVIPVYKVCMSEIKEVIR